MKKILNHIFFIISTSCTTLCFAGKTVPQPKGVVPPGDPELPIDSSLYVLMIIGIAFVLISYRRHKKRQFEN